MASVIDYNVFLWLAVAVIAFTLGSFYDKLQRERANRDSAKLKRQQQQQQNQQASWRPPAAQYNEPYSSFRHDSQTDWGRPQQEASQHSSNLSSRADQQQQQQQRYEQRQQDFHRQPSYLDQSYPGGEHEFRAAAAADDEQQAERSIPTATGFNADCVDWVNAILYAFYTHSSKYGPIIGESIYRSLNEKLASITSSSAELRHLSVEFAGINRAAPSSRPEMTNVRTESESEKSVSAVCKIYNQRLSFDLVVRPLGHNQNQQDQGQLNYELTFERLEGKLKGVAMLNDKLIVIQFMERPDTKIVLRPKHSFEAASARLQLISEDALVGLILQTLTQVVVDLYFGDDPEFPQFIKRAQQNSGYRNKLNLLRGGANEIKRQFKQDFFGALSGSSADKERKVFVKIIKALNINYNQSVTCLLELDAPHQQAMSSTKQGSNPLWEEHFLFAVSDKSSELVLELWDSIEALASAAPDAAKRASRATASPSQQASQGRKWSRAELEAQGKFLGRVRVSLEQLRREPVQKVSLMLEARQSGQASSNPASGRSIAMPSELLTNSVGGELQLELMFLEHSSGGQREQQQLQKSNSVSSIGYQQGDVVSVDRKLTPAGYVITTTTITKQPSQQRLGDKSRPQPASQSRHEQLSVRNQSPISSATEQSELELNFDGLSSQVGDNQSSLNEQQSAQQAGDAGSRAGSRSRSRSRSFLRAIRKRLSFSRTRSRSVGESGGNRLRTESRSTAPGERANLDKCSMESRSRASSETSIGRARSVPASRDPSEVPMIVINKSRLSDTASAFTFAHPKSQLVIECEEPQLGADGSNKQRAVTRYYAISDEQANKSKWRKRGTKLHLFNEHQFVACHLAGSSTCHLCGRVFSRRPGKQGYRCRNCHLLSHKQCHVKVDHNCPYAAREGLKLEFIDAEPPESLMRESGRFDRGASLPRQQANRPTRLQSGPNSISMDDR